MIYMSTSSLLPSPLSTSESEENWLLLELLVVASDSLILSTSLDA